MTRGTKAIIGGGALIVMLVIGGIAGWVAMVHRAEPVPASAEASTPPVSVDVTELIDRVDRLVARTARVDWDVDAKAQALAPGVEAAFALVRDDVRYEAYAGALRGASGAYAARAGNAIDRALLLARLLGRQHIATRFAIGTLGAADRERLLARTFESAAMTTEDRPPASGTGLLTRVYARARHDYDIVRTSLGDRLPPVTTPSRDALRAEMNPHVWVQADIDHRWIDLDPSFADAVPGTTIATLDRTATELPAELFQRIRIAIVEEQLSETGLARKILLETTRNAVDLIDRPILLSHAEPTTMKGIGFAIAGAAGVGTHNHWTPTLAVDDEMVVGTALEISPAFVAESLEIEMTWPGGRHETTTRPLLERGGAAWRATMPLDASTLKPTARAGGVPVAMAAVHCIWLSGGAHNLANLADALQTLVVETAAERVEGGEPAANPFTLQTFAWMAWSDQVFLPMLNDTPGLRLYPDGVRIAIFTQGLSEDWLTMVSDLRRDDLRGLSAHPDPDPAGGRRLAEKKLEFGLLQGALEQEALADVVRVAGGGADSGADAGNDGGADAIDTTSSALTAAGVVVITPGAPFPKTPAAVAVHPESASRIAAASARQAIVIAPVNGLGERGAWWEIAAGSGDTYAVSDLGLHGGKIGVPLKRLHQLQQNLQSGVQGSDARTAKQINDQRYLLRRAALQRKADREAMRYLERNALKPPAPGPRGGGNEYGVLLSAVTVVGAFGMRLLGLFAALEMFTQIDALVTWWAAHAHR